MEIYSNYQKILRILRHVSTKTDISFFFKDLMNIINSQYDDETDTNIKELQTTAISVFISV